MNRVILLKSGAGNQGGLEKYASRIASAFVEKGASVSVLTTGASEEVIQKGAIAFHSIKPLPWPAFLRMEQFDRFVQKKVQTEKADLVFGMDRNRFQTHIRAGNGVHAAYLESRILAEGPLKHLFCRFNPLHRKILELEKAAFENPDLRKLFTNSHFVRKQVLERYAVDPAKVQVIHNGVEWDEMGADFAAWEQQRRSDAFHFLFIGNGYLRKGLGCLLKGLSLLKTKNFHLSVIGKDNQIDLYRAAAIRLGIQSKVHFLGPSREIRRFYQLADALVIPSFYDPFANVTVEALAMGLFVVSSKWNGGHEILTEKNGAVIENLLDPDAMVEALEKAMEHPKTRLSAAAIRESVEPLDFSHQMPLLMEAL